MLARLFDKPEDTALARSSEPELVIDVEGLTKRFGSFTAVAGISLAVRPGEIFGILGPNGAGKSTTIRMLCGILAPSAGRGRVVGIDLFRDPERIKAQLGYMTQRFSLYEDLTVRENLEFYASVYGLRRSERRRALSLAVDEGGLAAHEGRVTGELSGGWKQRVALACATMHQPRLLVLDEPTANVDPVSRRAFWSRIHGVAARGTAVLLTTHYMDEAERCHRVAFVARGTLLDVGTPQELVERRALAVWDLVACDADRAEHVLRALPEVEDLVRYGDTLRVTTRVREEAVPRLARALGRHGVGILHAERRAAGVEDAFVAMLSREERAAMGGAPA